MFQIEFHLVRETKNYHVYEVRDGDKHIGKVYVAQDEAKAEGSPAVVVGEFSAKVPASVQ